MVRWWSALPWFPAPVGRLPTPKSTRSELRCWRRIYRAACAPTRFLINGALVVGFAMVPGAGRAFADTEVDTLGTQVLAPDLPGSLRTNPFLDAWIRIDEQDGITVY